MKRNEIYILGVGRNTEVYIDLAEVCGYKVIGLFHYKDDRVGESIHKIPIIDSNTNLFNRQTLKDMRFAISVGDNKIRSALAFQIRKLGGELPILIHPSAIVSQYSQIGSGVAINANSVVQAGVRIGQDTVITFSSIVTHTCIIGKSCYITDGSIVGAYVNIGDYVLIGLGAIVVSSKVEYIGSNSIIGAGSVVVKNVEANSVVAGNPARYIKSV
jgi:sugar O-acyltransferase (sialic acid O-acetyltransferase NeuD family)